MKRLSLLLLLFAACGFVRKDKVQPTAPTNGGAMIPDPFISDKPLLSSPDIKSKEDQEKPGFKASDDGNSPFGTLLAELVPHPGREAPLPSGAKVVEVTLRELSKTKSPQLQIERRRAAKTRESLAGLEVPGACAANTCADGLLDQRNKRTLIPEQPSQDELSLAKSGWMERLVRVVTVSEAHTSIYLGRVVVRDDEVKQALLECATYRRSDGERLSISTLLPPQRAASMLKQARALLQEQHPDYLIDPRSFLVMGPLPQGIKLCALSPLGANEAKIIEVSPL